MSTKLPAEILTTRRARGYDVCSGVGVDYDALLAALPCPHCHQKAIAEGSTCHHCATESGVCGHCSKHIRLSACQIGATVRLSGRLS